MPVADIRSRQMTLVGALLPGHASRKKFMACNLEDIRGIDDQLVFGDAHGQQFSDPLPGNRVEVLAVGDKVKVKVLDAKNGKLSLSIKQALEDPWSKITDKYRPEAKIKGKVTKKTDFGVFVQLEPGVEGLIHLTKIPPNTKIDIGQEVNCYIEGVDEGERRISLGIVLTTKPIGYK